MEVRAIFHALDTHGDAVQVDFGCSSTWQIFFMEMHLVPLAVDATQVGMRAGGTPVELVTGKIDTPGPDADLWCAPDDRLRFHPDPDPDNDYLSQKLNLKLSILGKKRTLTTRGLCYWRSDHTASHYHCCCRSHPRKEQAQVFLT